MKKIRTPLDVTVGPSLAMCVRAYFIGVKALENKFHQTVPKEMRVAQNEASSFYKCTFYSGFPPLSKALNALQNTHEQVHVNNDFSVLSPAMKTGKSWRLEEEGSRKIEKFGKSTSIQEGNAAKF